MVVRAIIVMLVLLGGASGAWAQKGKGKGKGNDAPKPWALNVLQVDQDEALRLYQKGNEFFEASQYKEALEQYRHALNKWDHPAIRYNAAVCLMNLDQVVEAFEFMTSALRYGDAPIGADLLKEGQGYLKTLGEQTGLLEVSIDEPGAIVLLDGVQLLVGPGRETRRLRVGDHQIVATKEPTHLSETRKVTVVANRSTSEPVALKLRPITRGRTARRWSWWKPPAVVVGGALVAGAGVLLNLQARATYGDFEDEMRTACSDGCTEQERDSITTDESARKEAIVSYSLLAAGGAVIGTGIFLIIANQPRTVAVTPAIGTDRVGLSVSGAW